MPKQTVLLLALATLSATAIMQAQSPDPAGPASASLSQSQPAPIERGSYSASGYNTYTVAFAAGQVIAPKRGTASAQPIPGVLVRVARNSSIRAVNVAGPVELKVERGLVNVNVHHPANNVQIMVDLPGGQTSLIKDGLYTFNASTNTVRVLRGEAVTFPPNQKQVKVKEDHSVTLAGPTVKSVEFDPTKPAPTSSPTPRAPPAMATLTAPTAKASTATVMVIAPIMRTAILTVLDMATDIRSASALATTADLVVDTAEVSDADTAASTAAVNRQSQERKATRLGRLSLFQYPHYFPL